MGANSDEVEVEFPGVNSELEEEDMEMTEMDPEENFEIPGVYMEGQETPHKSFILMILTYHNIQV